MDKLTHLQSARADPSKDPAVMMFTWWVGTLWLLMYDDTDGLLGPREEVYEFKGAGQGLTLVHFSAQAEPFLTQNIP